MLNPQIIAENITFLRQRMDLTQQELAEKASVTHQAVSKWENGSSIPDLQTLMTLSRLFGVTLDELLTEALAARRDAPAEPQPDAPQEPFAAREAETTEDVEPGDRGGTGEPAVALADLVALAPFLPKDRLSALVMEQIDRVTVTSLVPLAPFLGRQALDEIAARMDFSSVTPGRLVALAPFLSRETLSAAVAQMNPAPSSSELMSLAPFLGKNALGDLISRVGQLSMKALTGLAPFLSRDTISAQLDGMKKAGAPQREADKPAKSPADGAGNWLALRLAEKGDFDEIEDIFDRLDGETQERIVDMALEADDLDFLDGHMHRLPGEARRKVALRMAEKGDFDELGEFFDGLDGETQERIVDMALEADDLDFLDGRMNRLPGEARRKVALRMAEEGDFDELEDTFATLGEETRARIMSLAMDQDELAFLKRVHAAGSAPRQAAAYRAAHTERTERGVADRALNHARRGDFSTIPQLMARMTDEQKDEIVRLAIVFDDTDFLADLAADLPRDSLETLCFSLARMGEIRRLAAFQGYLSPETRLRVEKIVTEKK